MGTETFGRFYLRSVSIAFENLKQGFVRASSNASLSNVNLFNVFAFVSIRSDGPIVVNFSLQILKIIFISPAKTGLWTFYINRRIPPVGRILSFWGVFQNGINVDRCLPRYFRY